MFTEQILGRDSKKIASPFLRLVTMGTKSTNITSLTIRIILRNKSWSTLKSALY